MDTGSFMRATVYGNMPNTSNPVINAWDFRCLSASDANGLSAIGEAITAAFLARYYAPFVGVISNQFGISKVTLREYANPLSGYDEEGLLFVGANNGILLPTFCTFSVKMIRTNFGMKNGRKAYSGVTVAALNGDSAINDATRATFATVFAGWATTTFIVEADEADYSFEEVVVRKPTAPNTDPTMWYPVQNFSLNRFCGSQNTRKL